MNEEIKQEWLRELRSGKYKQGIGRLRKEVGPNQDEFCCLGVLCEIAVKHGVIEKGEQAIYDEIDPSVYRYGAEGIATLLPIEVIVWANIKYPDGGSVESEDNDGFVENFDLASWNDRGRTFTQLADLIARDL